MHRIRPVSALLVTLFLAVSACSITPSEPVETTTTTPGGLPAETLTLSVDGLGTFSFGDPAATVIDGLTATIGGWDADSDTNDLIDAPTCATGGGRIVSWGSLVLTFAQAGGIETFSGWSYGFNPLTANSDDLRGLNLETAEGIHLGSTRDELASAYDPNISFRDDVALDTATFIVDRATEPLLAGKLDAAGESGVVDFLETTPGC